MTIEVDPEHGDYATIGEAIAAAQAGDTIHIRPGEYAECLIVDKPLTLVGGDRGGTVIIGEGGPVFRLRAEHATLRSLTLRQAGRNLDCAVCVEQGQLTLEECDLHAPGSGSAVLSLVGAAGQGEIVVRGCRLDGSDGNGVAVIGAASATLEDNEIRGHWNGVAIATTGNVILRGNRIHDNQADGITVDGIGSGHFAANDLRENGHAYDLAADCRARVTLVDNRT